MNLLIKSAVIVDPGNTKLHLKKRDIHIKNGKLHKIAASINDLEGIRTLKLENLHISLGWFDSSVAFGEPGFEQRETIDNGLDVAAKSGFTEIILNTNTHPSPDNSGAIVFLKERGSGKCTQLYPLGNLTLSANGLALAELYDMHRSGAVGFYDFKSAIGNANLMKIALQYAQNFGGLVWSFPLNTQLKGKGVVNEGVMSTQLGLKGIPALAEELQIVRDLHILEYTDGALHIPTISTARSVTLISEAKKKGLNVSCSVAIHNLLLDDSCLKDFDSAYKVLPPLRTKEDVKALRKAVKNGTIDVVTSDHIPLDVEEKRLEFDQALYGTIGLESAFGVLNHIFGLEETIAILQRGRERFGISTPQLEEGLPANLSLFDPEPETLFSLQHVHSNAMNSAFLGTTIKGRPYGAINNGKLTLVKHG